MDYYDGDSRDEEDEELRSETLSPSEDGDGPSSKEPVASKRDRLRKVLLPAIQSRVAALGGWEDIIVQMNDGGDEDDDDDEEDDGAESSDGDAQQQHQRKQKQKQKKRQQTADPDATKTIRIYKLGDECLGCLKDLKRFWKMDDNDDDRNIARMFYETGLLNNDLVPILSSIVSKFNTSSRHEKAALASADLIAAMTWPINAIEELREAELSGDKATIEAIRKIDFSSLKEAQRSYKSAILKSNAIAALFKMLKPRLQRGFRDRSERDENVISLILHIFRNLAAIEDRRATANNSTETIEQANLQSDLICKLASDSVLDILITISSMASKTEYNRFNTICLEIFYLLFRGVERPELLVRKNADISKSIREEKLGKLLEAENTRKRMEGRRGVTRHSRFGTTVMIQNGKDRIVMHKQASVASAITNPGKVIDQNKRIRANRNVPTTNELSRPIELRPEALQVLQAVAMSFLESSFNPFLASLLADIRMQRPKIKEMDNTRFLFLSRFFLEYFLELYEYEKSQGLNPADEDSHDFDLIAEMTEPVSIAFVALRMKTALEEKPPLWTELHASVDCFAQVLLVIDALHTSGNEEYKEVAEVLQDKLYYEGDTLDMVLKVASTYKNQPVRYLDTIVHLVFVLLKMLEKFSKNKDYMFVKKKANRRAKKKANPEYDDMDEEEAEYEQSSKGYAEHAFKFKSFEERFANNSVMHTLLTYLSFYKEFTNEDQMKRVVNLLHRIAVKAKYPQLFYKASTLDLFKRVWDDKPCLPKTGAYNDLNKLASYIVKEFFKAAKEYPLLLMEVFFQSSKSEVRRLIEGDASDSEADKPKKLRMPQEIVVKKKLGYSWSQEVGIAVALLTDMNRDDLITWVKDTLSLVAKEREAVIAETDKNRDEEIDNFEQEDDEDDEAFARRKMAARSAGPSDAAKEAIEDYEILYEDEATQDAATRQVQLKLLLRLLKWESQEAEEQTHLIWTIPKALLPDDLRGYIKIIDEFLMEPLDPENGLSIAELVTKKAKPRVSKRRVPSTESEASSDDDGVVFSDPEVAAAVRGSRKKRSKGKSSKKSRRSTVGGDDDDDDAEGRISRRRQKRRKEAEEYRTAEFIDDSDVDEDADRMFFEREKRLREEMEKKSGLGNGLVERKVKDKKKKRKKTALAGGTANSSKLLATQDGSDSDGGENDDDMHGTQDDAERRPSRSAIQESSASESEPEVLAVAKAPRPKAKPKVTVSKGKSKVMIQGEGGSSELENRPPLSSPTLSDSPLAKGGNNNKRTRVMYSDDEDVSDGPSSPKQQAVATGRKTRMVIGSDDED